MKYANEKSHGNTGAPGARSSLSAELYEMYGKYYRPGSTTGCPQCQHETFWLNKHDVFAKCFHPTCGCTFRVGAGESPIHRVMKRLYELCHAELLSLKTANSTKNAYHYVRDGRRIHEAVIADSMLGAVPATVVIDGLFDPEIADLEDAIAKHEADRKGKAGRPPKNAPTPADDLKGLLAHKETLSTLLAPIGGWLMFFYTDAEARPTYIRLRQPYSKKILSFKPLPTTGLFNHHVTAPTPCAALEDLSAGEMIVTEGEFNLLQLQSLRARQAEAASLQPYEGYLDACAVGGVMSADLDALAVQAKKQRLLVCYDQDVSEGGVELARNINERVVIRACTTPGDASDLDSFIKSFGDDAEAAEAVGSLFKSAPVWARPMGAVKADLDLIRSARLKDFLINRAVGTAVAEDLGYRGEFFIDKDRNYVHLHGTKKVVAVDAEATDFKDLVSGYGVMPADDEFEHVRDHLERRARDTGRRTKVHKFSHFEDGDVPAVYLHTGGDAVIKICADRIDTVGNGTDGVFFHADPEAVPFERVNVPDDGESKLFDLLISKVNFKTDRLTEGDQRLVLLTWFLSLFFPELFPTKVILTMLGVKGSGKTSCLRRIGRVLFGPAFDVTALTKDARDFDAAASHEPLLVLDNADTPIDYLNDRLAVAATGSGMIKRRLYSDNSLFRQQYRAFLAITSRSPDFCRDDVVDRLLLLTVDRCSSFVGERQLQDEVDGARNRIMSEAILLVQQVLAGLQPPNAPSSGSAFRMAAVAVGGAAVLRRRRRRT